MSVFDRLMNSSIMGDAWKQVANSFRGGKLNQLMTMKPIEIYNGQHDYEIDTAEIKVDFQAFVENIIQKRLQNALQFLTFDFSPINADERRSYQCHVVVKARTDYENVGKYLDFNFAGRPYHLFDGKMELVFQSFKVKEVDRRLHFIIPMKASWKTRFYTFRANVTVHADGIVKYHPSSFTASATDIRYTYRSKNIILPFIDFRYHDDIIEALEDFLQISIEEELKSAMQKAQHQLDKFNEETPLIQGSIEELEMERLDIREHYAEAVFLAEGKIQLIP